MLRRAKVDYLDKEDMMGHKVGLEKHYERYQEEDFERFPEYQKAIPFLTISDDERQRLKIEELEQSNNALEKKEKEIKGLKDNMERIVDKKIDEFGKRFVKEMERFYEEHGLKLNKELDRMDAEFEKDLKALKENK